MPNVGTWTRDSPSCRRTRLRRSSCSAPSWRSSTRSSPPPRGPRSPMQSRCCTRRQSRCALEGSSSRKAPFLVRNERAQPRHRQRAFAPDCGSELRREVEEQPPWGAQSPSARSWPSPSALSPRQVHRLTLLHARSPWRRRPQALARERRTVCGRIHAGHTTWAPSRRPLQPARRLLPMQRRARHLHGSPTAAPPRLRGPSLRRHALRRAWLVRPSSSARSSHESRRLRC